MNPLPGRSKDEAQTDGPKGRQVRHPGHLLTFIHILYQSSEDGEVEPLDVASDP